MARQQINIKLPPELIEALREKASTEEITLTELIQGFCEQGLGLPPSNHQPVDTALIYERILTEVDNRIAAQLDIRIPPELEDPLLNQLEERIAFIVDTRISSQVALLEQRMATQLGERQETYKQWYSEACEVGRELERAQRQSPLSIESEPPVASSPPVAKRKAPPRASKSTAKKSGKKQPGVVKKLVEEKLLPGQSVTAKELAKMIGVTTPAELFERI